MSEIITDLSQFKTTSFDNANKFYAKGYAFYQGTCLDEEGLLKLLEGKSIIETEELIGELDGDFSVISIQEQETLVSISPSRAFPLFYKSTNDRLEIRDSLHHQKLTGNPSLINHFLLTGVTPSNTTLAEGWHQIEPGSTVVFSNGKIKRTSSFQLPISEQVSDSPTIEENLSLLFDRIIARLGGRQACIPLSGGLDSRLILAGLVQRGYKNIFCFTYGKTDSFEATTAQKLCSLLQVDWHFVEYTDEVLTNYFSETYKKYEDDSFHYSSLPYEQDFFAVQQLHDKNLIEDNAVFLPGFGADVLAGSWIPILPELNKASFTIEGVANHLLNSSKFFCQKTERLPLKDLILADIQTMDVVDLSSYVRAIESWGIKNRLMKYQGNSCRAYEYFGYDFMLPFLSKANITFWLQQPLHSRVDKKSYKEHISENLFRPLGIDFHFKNISSLDTHASLTVRLKSITPKFIRKIGKLLFINTKKQDVNNFMSLNDMILEKLNRRDLNKEQNINFVEANYLLSRRK